MISFDQIAGNAALKSDLRHAVGQRLAQTVLLSAATEGAALDTAATVLAAALLCEQDDPPCGECLSCRKVEGGVHPDLTIVDEGENEIKVDAARRISAESVVLPNDGARRVTIIRHAHNLNAAAQNALLKTLEEPPRYAFFILSTDRPDALLQTVRSRCLKFVFAPENAAQQEYSELLAPYVRAAAEGSECRLMQAALALEKLPRRALLKALEELCAALRDAVFFSKGLVGAPLFPALREQTAKLARTVSAPRLLALYTFVGELQSRVGRNAASAAITCALTADVFRICFL